MTELTRGEIEEIRAELHNAEPHMTLDPSEIDAICDLALAAQEDKKDAKRYRWLNSNHSFLAYVEADAGTKRYNLRCGEPLNRWIDDAIAALESGKEGGGRE